MKTNKKRNSKIFDNQKKKKTYCIEITMNGEKENSVTKINGFPWINSPDFFWGGLL